MISELQNHQAESQFQSIDKAIDVMIEWLGKYQDEALDCEALVLATILNPRLRGKFFSIHYPDHEVSAHVAIKETFKKLVEESTNTDPAQPPNETDDTDAYADEFDMFGVTNSGPKSSPGTELDDYLSGHCAINKDQTPLEWWKVGPLSFSPLYFRYSVSFTLLNTVFLPSGASIPIPCSIETCPGLFSHIGYLMCV